MLITDGGQQPTNDISLGGQQPTIEIKLGGQQPSILITEGGQQPSILMTDGGQQPTIEIKLGGQQPSMLITDGGQQPSMLITDGGQQPSILMTDGGQQPIKEIKLGGQQPSILMTDGGQQPTMEISLGKQQPTIETNMEQISTLGVSLISEICETEHSCIHGPSIGGKLMSGPGQDRLGATKLGKSGTSGMYMWNGCTVGTGGTRSQQLLGVAACCTMVHFGVVTVTVGLYGPPAKNWCDPESWLVST
jgi:hypothetical protein